MPGDDDLRVIEARHAWPVLSRDGDRYVIDLGRRAHLAGELAAVRNYVGQLVRLVNAAVRDDAPHLGPVDPGPAPGWSRAAQQLADYRSGDVTPGPEGPLRPIEPGEDW